MPHTTVQYYNRTIKRMMLVVQRKKKIMNVLSFLPTRFLLCFLNSTTHVSRHFLPPDTPPSTSPACAVVCQSIDTWSIFTYPFQAQLHQMKFYRRTRRTKGNCQGGKSFGQIGTPHTGWEICVRYVHRVASATPSSMVDKAKGLPNRQSNKATDLLVKTLGWQRIKLIICTLWPSCKSKHSTNSRLWQRCISVHSTKSLSKQKTVSVDKRLFKR